VPYYQLLDIAKRSLSCIKKEPLNRGERIDILAKDTESTDTGVTQRAFPELTLELITRLTDDGFRAELMAKDGPYAGAYQRALAEKMPIPAVRAAFEIEKLYLKAAELPQTLPRNASLVHRDGATVWRVGTPHTVMPLLPQNEGIFGDPVHGVILVMGKGEEWFLMMLGAIDDQGNLFFQGYPTPIFASGITVQIQDTSVEI
jgi:hypothetical protein